MSTVTTTLLGVLPNPTTGFGGQDGNIAALSRYSVERYTNSTAPAITLRHAPVVGLEQVYKNGTLLDRDLATADYTISGQTLTLTVAPLTSDVIRVFYYFRNR